MSSSLNIFISVNILLHALLFTTTFANPSYLPALQPRNQSPSSSAVPGIEATITSPTGDDVTSNFQILLYKQSSSPPPPQEPEVASSNLTNRQVGVSVARPLNFCWHQSQEFAYSHCNYPRHRSQSLQRYIIYCRQRVQSAYYIRTTIVSQRGTCNKDEICVDGVGGLDRQHRNTTAKCVSRSFFQPLAGPHTAEDEKRLTQELRRIMGVVAVVAQTDGTTPLNVGKLELDTGVVTKPRGASGGEGEVGEGREEGGGGLQLQGNQSCTNCFTLSTSKFGEQTDFLKTQAKLSTIGAATAGIIYLAALSG